MRAGIRGDFQEVIRDGTQVKSLFFLEQKSKFIQQANMKNLNKTGNNRVLK